MMVRFGVKFIPVVTCLILLTLAACQGLSPGSSGSEAGQMTFSGPNKETVPVGGMMPGTGVQYIRSDEEKGAELRIDGQLAYKKSADSVKWQGAPVAGTELSVNQWVLWHNDESLGLGGTVTIIVEGVDPKALPSVPDAPVRYSLPATYNVVVGEAVPGTHLMLDDIIPEKGAEFSGWYEDQYGLRQIADSVGWDGSLRDGVQISQRLRVAWIGDDAVRLAGIVHILLAP